MCECVRACWLRVQECGECGALLRRGRVRGARVRPRGWWQNVCMCPACVRVWRAGPEQVVEAASGSLPGRAGQKAREGVMGAPRPPTPTCRAVCCFASSARRWQAADPRRRPGCGAPGGWRGEPGSGGGREGPRGGLGLRALLGAQGRGGSRSPGGGRARAGLRRPGAGRAWLSAAGRRPLRLLAGGAEDTGVSRDTPLVHSATLFGLPAGQDPRTCESVYRCLCVCVLCAIAQSLGVFRSVVSFGGVCVSVCEVYL